MSNDSSAKNLKPETVAILQSAKIDNWPDLTSPAQYTQIRRNKIAFRHLSSQAGSTRKRRSGLGGLENQNAWTIFFGPTPLWSPNTPLDQKDSLLAALYGCARLFLLPSLHV